MSNAFATLLVNIAADVSQLKVNMGSAVGVLRNTERQIDQVMKHVRHSIEAAFAGAGVIAVKKLSQELGSAFLDLAKKGDVASVVAENFRKLGGSAPAIEDAKRATLGMVGATELMTVANSALARGFPQVNQHITLIADVATRWARANNQEVLPSIEGLTDALVRGKPKLLEHYLGTINTDKAMIEYAKAHKKAGQSVADYVETLGAAQKADAVRAEGLRLLAEQQQKLAPITDTVTTALEALKTSWGDLGERIGEELNRNPQVIQSFRDLSDTLDGIDGDNIAHALGLIADGIHSVVDAVNAAASVTNKLDDFGHRLMAFTFARGAPFKPGQSQTGKFLDDLGVLFTPTAPETLANYRKMLRDKAEADLKARGIVPGAPLPPLTGGGNGGSGEDESLKLLKKEQDERDKARKKTEEQAKAAAQLRSEWEKSFEQLEKRGLADALGKAIEKLDQVRFTGLLDRFKAEVGAGAERELKQRIAKGLDVSAGEAAAFKDAMINDAVEPFVTRMQERMKDAFRDSVSFWHDIFSQAIEGGGLDLKRVLKDVAVGFAAQMAASLTGGFSLQGGVGNLGGLLASAVGFTGPGQKPGFGGILQGLGIGAGVAGGAGLFSSGSSALAAPTILSASRVPAGAVAGAGAGAAAINPYALAAVAAFTVGPSLFKGAKGLFGGGKPHPDTEARKQVEAFLEEKLGRNVVFGGSGRFNSSAGFASFNKLDDKAKSVFGALGEGIVATLGITRKIGPQIAAVIADDVGGSIEKVSGLLDRLGLNAADMADKIMESGIKTGKTWLEIEGQLEGLDMAMSHSAQGAQTLGEAFQHVTSSQGAGLGPIDALRRMAELAQGQGAKTLADMKKLLLAQGVGTPEQIEQIFKAMDMRGVNSLEALKTAGDRTVGAMIADITAMGFQWDQVAASIEKATEAIKNLGRATGGTAVPSVGGPDADVPAFASGGIVSRATIGMLGESGPEAILPLTRRGGRLGVLAHGGMAAVGGGSKGGIHVQVYAPNAEPGMEQRIRRAIQDMGEHAVREAVHAVADQRLRGGSYGNVFDR